ncbi:MAG: hypothetical protein ACIWVG_00705 [Gloeotrichia echinulata HAB0833]
MIKPRHNQTCNPVPSDALSGRCVPSDALSGRCVPSPLLYIERNRIPDELIDPLVRD